MPSESTKFAIKFGLGVLNMMMDQMERAENPEEQRDGPPPIVYDFIRLFEDLGAEQEESTPSTQEVTKQEDDDNSDSESAASFHSAHSNVQADDIGNLSTHPSFDDIGNSRLHSNSDDTGGSHGPGVITIPETISLLTKHGCKNVTSLIDWSEDHFRSGGFGDVYKAKLRDGTLVAVKTPISPIELSVDTTPAHLKKAAREIHTWHKCQHPNIAKLLGVAEFRGKIGMVSPWASNGNLQGYVQREPSANRCYLSAQVCDGLAYLHENNTVHGDLKAENVVVSESGVPMITDFGHAFLSHSKRSLSMSSSSHWTLGTMRWTAPEIITQETTRSIPGDVYSLGMTILEIFTGQIPYSDVDRIALYGVIVHQAKLPTRPKSHMPPNIHGNMLWSLLSSCWARDIDERPSAAEVRDMMKTFTPEKLKHGVRS